MGSFPVLLASFFRGFLDAAYARANDFKFHRGVFGELGGVRVSPYTTGGFSHGALRVKMRLVGAGFRVGWSGPGSAGRLGRNPGDLTEDAWSGPETPVLGSKPGKTFSS